VLDDWVVHTSSPSVFFEGGPVQQNSIIGLARFADGIERSWTSSVGDGLHTIDLNSDATNGAECSALRLFIGYSGWGPQQLDQEISEQHWFVLDAQPADAFGDAQRPCGGACSNVNRPIANGSATFQTIPT